MGGIDTKGRYHVHWGPPETYGERRDEMRAATVRPARPGRVLRPFRAASTSRPLEAILEDFDHDPKHMLQILEATQAAYGHLPVAALKLISHRTGAWYAMIYGTASYYRHLRFEPPGSEVQAAAIDAHRPVRGDLPRGLDAALAGGGGASAGRARPRRRPRARPDDGDDPARRPPAGRAILLDRGRAPAWDDPPRPRRARSTRGAFEGLKRCVHELGPRARSRRSPRPGCAAAAAPASRPARSGGSRPRTEAADALRRRERLRRRPVGRDRPDAPGGATRSRSSRASRSPRSRSARARRSSPSAREATEAIRRLEGAIARRRGRRASSAPSVLGSGRSVTITVRPVQGAYMLGEETVLLKALEGKRGQPEQRPPHPAERGLFDRPTVVQNVQTLAAVPWILANGAEAFAAIGSKASPGTILVQVRGAGRRRHRGGPARDAAPGRRRAGRRGEEAQGRARRRARPAGCCRPTCSTRRTSSTRCARSGPTSGPARSSPPTSGPASSTSPGS